MKLFLPILLVVANIIVHAQIPTGDIHIGKTELSYSVKLEKGGLYSVVVMQKGIDVVVRLKEKGTDKILVEKDSPNGNRGPEEFEYSSPTAASAVLTVQRLEETGNPESGDITVSFRKFTKAEIQLREKIKQEVAPENAKTVQTLDVDHFWEAFDKLAKCANHADSINIIQTVYLDRGTDGLRDFIQIRDFSAERFVSTIHKFPRFYASVRQNTFEVKKAAPLIEDVFQKFKEIYPNFKPFKVCFAIGPLVSGGTVTDNFVLIGSEISTSTSSVDVSELNNSPLSKVLSQGTDVVQKIKNMVAHECVHTQQKTPFDPNAVRCVLLNNVLHEGFADFIGELVSGSQINQVALEYGDQHEQELWKQLKEEMCSSKSNNWLYNFTTVKDKPADLGYYMGYTIAREYYKNAPDKKQAIVDIIEMNNPLAFLEKSRYDQKEKAH
jgi:hypothetical protein